MGIVLGGAWMWLAAAGWQVGASEPPVKDGPGAAEAKTARVFAVVETEKGTIRMELFAGRVPVCVASFVNLARLGFYDGMIVNRVIARATVETGCPHGKGIGWPGYKLADEFVPGLKHDSAGVVSLANAGPNTNGCRFFITLRAMPSMDGRNTIIGKVLTGMEVVRKLQVGDVIRSIKIEGNTDALLERMKDRVTGWTRAVRAKFPQRCKRPVEGTRDGSDPSAEPGVLPVPDQAERGKTPKPDSRDGGDGGDRGAPVGDSGSDETRNGGGGEGRPRGLPAATQAGGVGVQGADAGACVACTG